MINETTAPVVDLGKNMRVVALKAAGDAERFSTIAKGRHTMKNLTPGVMILPIGDHDAFNSPGFQRTSAKMKK